MIEGYLRRKRRWRGVSCCMKWLLTFKRCIAEMVVKSKLEIGRGYSLLHFI